MTPNKARHWLTHLKLLAQKTPIFPYLARRRLRRRQPIIIEDRGRLPVGETKHTFVAIVGPHYDQTKRNAPVSARQGWCRAFEAAGIPYLILSVHEAKHRLSELPGAICMLTQAEYEFLTDDTIATLKLYPHFVWINTWFDGEANYYRTHNFEHVSSPMQVNRKVLASEPAFVYTISPPSGFQYYENWQKTGIRFHSLPLACDTILYHPQTDDDSEFSAVEIAFVGGYWAYKARELDRYLKPYQDQLTIFGYNHWPYAGYGGPLDEKREPALYRQAKLAPTINEPHVSKMNIDLNERVFKVLGSGGMTITDATPGYRDWFTESELLVPTNEQEYHTLVHTALSDPDFNARYRQRGRQAVLARHTYHHRVAQVLDHLDIQVMPRASTEVS